MRVRTYGFPGCFTRPTGDLDSQLPTRIDHVEACRPRMCATNSSWAPESRNRFTAGRDWLAGGKDAGSVACERTRATEDAANRSQARPDANRRGSKPP